MASPYRTVHGSALGQPDPHQALPLAQPSHRKLEPQHPLEPGQHPALVETGQERGPRVEAVTLVKKGSRRPAGVSVGLEHRDLEPGLGQQGRGGKAADPSPDDNHAHTKRR